MAKYNSLGELFAAIANSIREKTGSTDPIVAEDIPTVIEGISAGASGEMSVGDLDALLEGSITELTSNATTIKQYGAVYCPNLTKVRIPLATSIGYNAFWGLSSLESVYAPLVQQTENGTFYQCPALKDVNLDSLTKIGGNDFADCTSLTKVCFPSVTVTKYLAFARCTSLKIVDLPSATSLDARTFLDCKSLIAIVLRSSTKCFDEPNALEGCCHYSGTVDETYNPDGLKDGYIYVPRSLIDVYPTYANWSEVASQFRALEDYTVDGTTTGELDESKVSL